jgi:ech hydrogenase subunit B
MLFRYLPLSLAALFLVLVIKLQKSPYDIAHAHTELVSGPLVEYSGPYLAILDISKWVEMAVVFGIFTLFWNDPDPLIAVLGKAAIVLLALFASLVLDNITARLTRSRMVRFTLGCGMALVAINLLWNLYLGPVVAP